MTYINDEVLSKAYKAAKEVAAPGTAEYRKAFKEAFCSTIDDACKDVSFNSKMVSVKGVTKHYALSFRQAKIYASNMFGKDTPEYKAFLGG